ncbi:MAG: hypothetical protein ABL967_09200 [Bryobacteraceae bacterium]
MQKYTIAFASAALAALLFSPCLSAQPAPQSKELVEALAKRKWNNSPPVKAAYANKRPSRPAPKRDLSGIWDGTAEGGVEATGPREYPAGDNGNEISGREDESAVKRQLPFTAAGLAALKKNKPGVGVRSVDVALSNDPVNTGNPQGFPRMLFYELRVFEWAQLKGQWIYLDQFMQNYRVVWADGRPLPDINEVEPRWFGYSAGKWTDDYTFEIDTIGVNEKTWLDNAGRPHTYEMKVHEVWHRLDYDTMELTVTVDDPKYYSQKWNGLQKFIVHRLPDTFDMEEFIYNGLETSEYDDLLGTKAIIGKGK